MVYDPERAHFRRLKRREKELQSEGHLRIAGIDEVGRGPLAGPVVAAACILPPKAYFRGLNDSKQVPSEERERLFQELTSHPEVQFGVGIEEVEVIDRVNIFQAAILAMRKALHALVQPPDYLLIDGKHLPSFEIPAEAIIAGDGKVACIAAASILAKVTRDRIMVELDTQWPQYGFAKHKGYATQVHLESIQKWGPCPIHRKAFL